MDTQNNVFTLITFTDYIHLCFSVLFRFVERFLHRIYVHMMDYPTPFRQASSVFPNFYVYDR